MKSLWSRPARGVESRTVDVSHEVSSISISGGACGIRARNIQVVRFWQGRKSQGGSIKKERTSYDAGGATEDEAEWPIADMDTVSSTEFEA